MIEHFSEEDLAYHDAQVVLRFLVWCDQHDIALAEVAPWHHIVNAEMMVTQFFSIDPNKILPENEGLSLLSKINKILVDHDHGSTH